MTGTRRATSVGLWSVVLLALMLTLPTGVALGSISQSHQRWTKHAVPRWRNIFLDNFGGRAGSSLPSKVWRYYSGGGGSLATFVPTAAYAGLDGHGDLVVTARHTRLGWQSGQVATVRSFMPKRGQSLRAQARIEMPNAGASYWPAFWALAAKAVVNPRVEPAAGEIDIAETTDDRPWVAQFLHCGPAKFKGPCREPAHATSDFHHFKFSAGRVGYHLYTMVWSNLAKNQSLTFLVDNRVQKVVTEKQLGTRYWNLAFDHPYVFIFDIAIGGWGGPPNRTSGKWGSMHVDFFSVSVANGAPRL